MSLRVTSHTHTKERAVVLADVRDEVKGRAEAAFDGLPSFLAQGRVCGGRGRGGREGMVRNVVGKTHGDMKGVFLCSMLALSLIVSE